MTAGRIKSGYANTDWNLVHNRSCVASTVAFYVQFSYYAVHTPVLAMPDTIDRFREMDSRQHTNTFYAAMTAELDDGVGQNPRPAR